MARAVAKFLLLTSLAGCASSVPCWDRTNLSLAYQRGELNGSDLTAAQGAGEIDGVDSNLWAVGGEVTLSFDMDRKRGHCPTWGGVE